MKALSINQNIAKSQIVNQVQNTNAVVYFVPLMDGCVLNIGLKKTSVIVRKDTYASIAGMK